MRYPTPTVSFTIDSGYGESTFRETFRNSHEALAYISGYLGAHPAMLKDFAVDFDWDTTTSEG